MIYSGVDLIRTSGDQAERLKRLDLADGIEASVDIDTGLDSETGGGDLTQFLSEGGDPPPEENPEISNVEPDTQGALLRFAKFVKGEVEGIDTPKPKPNLRLVRGAAPGLLRYQAQIENPSGQPATGTLLKIRV
jgi:hypothetical protein